MNRSTTRHRRLRRRAAALVFAVAGIVVPVAQATPTIPGYTDFPNALRVKDELASRSTYIAGYTDFPNALRVADQRGLQAVPERSAIIAGYTDFPNALRVKDELGASQRSVAAPSQPSVVGNGFDWNDAGIGAGTAVGLCLLLLASVLVFRNRIRPARLP